MPTAPEPPQEGKEGEDVVPDQAEQDMAKETHDSVPERSYQSLPVVALGGSAGGLAALQIFFHCMPADSGMAFVVILHLSPEHESMMAEVLQRSSLMPVIQVSESVKVEPNHVYVIPPAKHLSISDGELRLSELLPKRGRRVAVDLFLRTLADTHGPHSIGIVLSGADSDGAIGIKRIKERGGLTIAQEPSEAEHPGMPLAAIGTRMVDWVLPVKEMPGRLLNFLATERRISLVEEMAGARSVLSVPASEKQAALRDIFSILRTRTGRDFSSYKQATILRRIGRRMQVNGIENLLDYVGFLRIHSAEPYSLLQDLLVSVTNFFRDRTAFEALEKRIPDLLNEKKAGDELRVWVAGCATGEEAYSIAILLHEHIARCETPLTSIQVFATDLDENSIGVAREGLYPETIAADVSEERLLRFFVKSQGAYRVKHELRESVLFAVHDLLKDPPFSRIDLVSCRNLLIYLKRAAQERAINTIHFALRPEGMLFLGSSESVDEVNGLFAPLDKRNRLFVRKHVFHRELPLPSHPSAFATARRAAAAGALAKSRFNAGTSPFEEDAPASGLDVPSLGELHLKLLELIAAPSLVVDSQHNIIHLSQQAGRYLQFSGGRSTLNLLRAVHPMLRVELRLALYRAAQTGDMVEARNLPVEINGATRTVNIRVCTVQELDAEFFLVVFDEGEADSSELTVASSAKEADSTKPLEEEIDRLKAQFRATVEEYEASNEEMKASNEELQAMNEELRSATEELETSREELHSINEELTTVNQELKSKVDELRLANSDLQNLMASTNIATVFLDRELCITRYTPPAVALFNLIPGDIGRPLSDLHHRLQYESIAVDADRVLEQLSPIEREVCSTEGTWFLARLLPYRTSEDQIAGIVLTFIDISQRKSAEAALEKSREQLLEALHENEKARAAVEASNASKDHFLAVLSHELRTPLSPVLIGIQSLLRRSDIDQSFRSVLEMILRNLEVETHFIDDLLDLTRISHGKLEFATEPIDLHEVIQRALKVCEHAIQKKNQRLAVVLGAQEHRLIGDFARLEQVVWNLVENASKFSPEGGAISVESRNNGNQVVIEVADKGIGIDPAALPNIFEAFTQGGQGIARKFGGLGLGLAISKATVEAHGGTLRAQSEGLGSGASFIFSLPLQFSTADRS